MRGKKNRQKGKRTPLPPTVPTLTVYLPSSSSIPDAMIMIDWPTTPAPRLYLKHDPLYLTKPDLTWLSVIIHDRLTESAKNTWIEVNLETHCNCTSLKCVRKLCAPLWLICHSTLTHLASPPRLPPFCTDASSAPGCRSGSPSLTYSRPPQLTKRLGSESTHFTLPLHCSKIPRSWIRTCPGSRPEWDRVLYAMTLNFLNFQYSWYSRSSPRGWCRNTNQV
jgi:hypothetical protein